MPKKMQIPTIAIRNFTAVDMFKPFFSLETRVVVIVAVVVRAFWPLARASKCQPGPHVLWDKAVEQVSEDVTLWALERCIACRFIPSV
jgi:hypothetical protein